MAVEFDPSNLNYLSTILIGMLVFFARKYITGLDEKFDKMDQKMDSLIANVDNSVKDVDKRLIDTREELVGLESKADRNAADIQKIFSMMRETGH